MFDSAILDVAIGITFVFVLVSTLCAAIREALEQMLKTRAAYLERAIRELLHDGKGEALARSLYEHPLVYGLYRNGYSPLSSNGRLPTRGGDLPSYIPARTFALAIIDLAVRGPLIDAASAHPEFAELSWKSLRESVGNLQSPPVQRVLLSAIDSAQGNLDAVRENLEAWYDDGMQRASGWYKRFTQKVIFVIGLFVACALNINPITIAQELYADRALREAVVAAAEKATAPPTAAEASRQLNEIGLPLGWADGWGAPIGAAKRQGVAFEWWNDLVAPILGLLITAVAAMLGAPFWFDVLKRVMTIRATAKPPEGAAAQASAPSRVGAPAPRLAPAAPASALGSAAAPAPDRDFDLCGRSFDDDASTSDEELPAARGGVAS